MNQKLALVAVAGMAIPSVAMAATYFTYDDPEGPPREFMYVEGNAGGDGSITFTNSTNIDLVVDATEDLHGLATYSVTLTMDFSVGMASSLGGVWYAPISGTFAFNDGVDDILSGVINDGAFLTFGTTGSLQANSIAGSLSMTAAGALLAQFDGFQPGAPFNASWALSDFLPGPPSLNNDNYLTSFTANTAFVGSAVVPIPTPGSAALLAVASLISLPRRRS